MSEPEQDDPPRAPVLATTDDEDREAILKRRARFVASAMAGLVLGGANACSEPGPQACLSPPPLVPTPSSAGADSASPPSDPPPATSGSSDPPPQPCLEIPPQPCLRYAPPPAGSTSSSAAPGSSAPAPSSSPLPPSTNPFPKPCLKMARPPEQKK